VGQESVPCEGDVPCPTEKPESSFCRFELLHCSQICLRGLLLFSRNSVMCPHLLHLYSNIGILYVSRYKPIGIITTRADLHADSYIILIEKFSFLLLVL